MGAFLANNRTSSWSWSYVPSLSIVRSQYIRIQRSSEVHHYNIFLDYFIRNLYILWNYTYFISTDSFDYFLKDWFEWPYMLEWNDDMYLSLESYIKLQNVFINQSFSRSILHNNNNTKNQHEDCLCPNNHLWIVCCKVSLIINLMFYRFNNYYHLWHNELTIF